MSLRATLSENLAYLMSRAGIRTYAEPAARSGLSKTQKGNIIRNERGASIDSLDHLLLAGYVLLAAVAIQRVVAKEFDYFTTLFLVALLCLRWYWKRRFEKLGSI